MVASCALLFDCSSVIVQDNSLALILHIDGQLGGHYNALASGHSQPVYIMTLQV